MRPTITQEPRPLPALRVPSAAFAAPPQQSGRTSGASAERFGKIHLQFDEPRVISSNPFAPCLTAARGCLPTTAVETRKKHGIDRDFERYKTIVDVPEAPTHLWAVSDIHGDYDRAVKLLRTHKLVTVNAVGDVHWAAGDAALVVCGDMIDKGPKNLETLELMQILEMQAQRAGGRVITLLGNHEVQFLANPFNDKSKGPGGIFWDLREFDIDVKTFASDHHPTGFWLRRLPFGARVGNWFFAHGGQTSGRSMEGLRTMLEVALGANGFKDTLVAGPNSLVRGRNWYGNDAAKGQENARLLGVQHIVFGHDPDTIAPRGRIIGFPADQQQQLFRIDTGLSVGVNYSHGELLHIEATEKGDLCHACMANGNMRTLGLFERPQPPTIGLGHMIEKHLLN